MRIFINLLRFGLVSILCLSNIVYSAEKPHEELMIVQAVSKNRKSFVLSKGLNEGIVRGQEVIFANENVSLLCRALEVNRNYSLWIPVDKFVNIPFKKEDIISYNTHAYGNVALDIVGDAGDLTPKLDYDAIYSKFRKSNNISLKGSMNRGLSQSSSDVSADKNSSRSGYTFSAEYNYRFMPEFELSFGGRIDNEVYRLTSPQLDIPTSRVMGTIAATYHLMNLTSNQNNFYLSVAAGIGKSTTTVNDETSTGSVTLLPEARLGYIMPFSKSTALIFEGSIESLSAKEKFADQAEQVTNILNVKFTLGLRF